MKMSFSRCKMYNLSTAELLELELREERNLSVDHHISKFEQIFGMIKVLMI